jgi:hypothetical protein
MEGAYQVGKWHPLGVANTLATPQLIVYPVYDGLL